MIKNIAILGSTGSIGTSTLSVLYLQKNYKIKLLTTNNNVNKIYNQAIKFNVKDVIIENKKKYLKYKKLFLKKNIKLHLGLHKIETILKKKLDYTINAISGIEGLEPTLKIIPKSKNILIANKESIICGWDLIKKNLSKYKTNFIPIDSEHFSIWKMIKNENKNDIEKVILTASGGPFLKISPKKLYNIKPKFALKHPNWKMGKKISIDSSTMMNKIFEFIEAKKIFNLKNDDLSILIHPTSYIHAIVVFKGQLIKYLAHETRMTIPISNALGINNKKINNLNKHLVLKLNKSKFMIPNKSKFPILSIIDFIPDKSSYFETILISLNDSLVKYYLKGHINYVSIQRNLINLIKKPYFTKYYKLKPKNIYDIKNMIRTTKNYISKNIKYYEK